jgi:hypothetical protein
MLKKEKAPKEDQILASISPDERAPYTSPELHVYGDVAKVTQTAGAAGNVDGGLTTHLMMTH